jgi:hypothetical protein
MASSEREQVDDVKVLGYWQDWLRVRETAVMAGWSFAGYVWARVEQERDRRLILASSGTNAPLLPPYWQRESSRG